MEPRPILQQIKFQTLLTEIQNSSTKRQTTISSSPSLKKTNLNKSFKTKPPLGKKQNLSFSKNLFLNTLSTHRLLNKRTIQFPTSSRLILQCHPHRLTKFEKSQILSFQTIYFIGAKTKQTNKFDDCQGDYIVQRGAHIAYRYELLSTIGKGCFGKVVKAYDHKNKQAVAIKILKSSQNIQKQAAIEIKILRRLKKNDIQGVKNTVIMKEYFYFRHHICISFQLLYLNVYDFIRLNQFKGLSLKLIQSFTKQILQSLKLTHSLKIIHCDLKPENIILKSPKKIDVKLIDFGTSCFEYSKNYTYIQSRYYRAPEIILGKDYTNKIDIWSLGCILFQFYTGFPLFPGENQTDQLVWIMSLKGLPPIGYLEDCQRSRQFFDQFWNPLVYCEFNKERCPGSRKLEDLLKGCDKLFVDFVKRCLMWEADERPTAEELMQHEWITGKARNASTPKKGWFSGLNISCFPRVKKKYHKESSFCFY